MTHRAYPSLWRHCTLLTEALVKVILHIHVMCATNLWPNYSNNDGFWYSNNFRKKTLRGTKLGKKIWENRPSETLTALKAFFNPSHYGNQENDWKKCTHFQLLFERENTNKTNPTDIRVQTFPSMDGNSIPSHLLKNSKNCPGCPSVTNK